MSVEWIIVTDQKIEIGAVGFINNKALVVVSFFDALDADRSGSVSWTEWVVGKVSPLSLENKALTEVAMTAKYDMKILQKDPGFIQMANDMFANFARGLVLDGVYAVYFGRGVKMAGGGVAKMITSNMIKQMAIRKGFEKTVREAFNAATDR